jgi:parallel beta-helix repeat protein
MNIVRPTLASMSRVLLASVSFLSLGNLTGLAQGGLTPPPGPPAPTMKSLDQIETRIPISSLPLSITNPGSYYVTTNLTGVAGTNGITIYTNNVTIDLNGFTLEGVPGSIDGITGVHVTNICVRDGIVHNWGATGVNLLFSTFAAVIERVQANANGQYGIALENGIVRGCVANANNTATSGGIAGIDANSSTIVDCVANANLGIADGIACGSGVNIVHCFTTGNGGDGIVAFSGCTILGCSSFSNQGRGIFASIDSTIQECLAVGNTGDNIDVSRDTLVLNNIANGSSGAGIHASFVRNRIEGNQATQNRIGILIDANATNNIVVRNSCSANPSFGPVSSSNYVFNATVIFGPTNNLFDPSTGLITNVNPWANFSR